MIDSRLAGRGIARAEDAPGTPTQSHTSPSILVYKDKTLYYSVPSVRGDALVDSDMNAFEVKIPPSSECGTCKTVKARFWPWLEPFFR